MKRILYFILLLFCFACREEFIKTPLEAEFVATKTEILAGESIEFGDQSLGEPESWIWTFDGGTPASSRERKPRVLYNTPGTYAVKLSISTNDNSEELIKPGYIEVSSSFEADFTVTQTEVLLDGELQFADRSAGNPGNFLWIFEGGVPNTSTDQNPKVKYPALGLYDVTLIISNAFETDTLRREDYIQVEEPVQADFSVPDTAIETGGVLRFTDQSTGSPTTFQWTIEGANPNVSIEKNPQVQYNVAGTYQVKLLVSNDLSSDELIRFDFIDVYDPIDADFTVNSTSINQGQNITLTDASSGSPTSWAWVVTRSNLRPGEQPVSRLGSSTTISNLRAGTYKVKLTASNVFTSDTEEKSSFFIVN